MRTREIKFRMYDTKRKEWLHDTEHAVSLFGETIMLGGLWSRRDDTHVEIKDMNDIVAMQFTGLLDKNGKEIYEGDIVKFYFSVDDILQNKKPIITSVSYEEGTFFVMKINDETCLLRDAVKSWTRFEKGGLEIIGNLYETPELLK